MITGAQIVNEARAWIDTRWHHAQALKGVGCDCVGLLVGVGEALGIKEATAFKNDRRFKGYGRPPNPRLLLLACDEYLDRVVVSDVRLGDITLARVEIEPQHFGIVSSLEPFRIIHTYTQVGRVTENIIDDRWFDKLLRVYRFRGVQ